MINVFWFRRDLRLEDNAGLFYALNSGLPVLPLFIFDEKILNDLEKDDARITLLYDRLVELNDQLSKSGSGILVIKGEPVEVISQVLNNYDVNIVFANHDYEPYAINRDDQVKKLLDSKGIEFKTYKDQVIFEKGEVVKDDGNPYTIYTPYMKKWFERFNRENIKVYHSQDRHSGFIKHDFGKIPDLKTIGFKRSNIRMEDYDIGSQIISNYKENREYPHIRGTSRTGAYLRFGFIGIRQLVHHVKKYEPTFLKELIWREFFMQILYHFPHVVDNSFKPKYDRVQWINDKEKFKKWCEGRTGYPLVDAGMRELVTTGYMHNRVRMVTSSFLCKHLLIDWRWGEAWFAKHLLDYELSSNNGNWQWAAGSGCDATPYFRVFNPFTQQKKFDPDMKYIKKWIPEINSNDYPDPIVDHKSARLRAIETYKKSISD